MTPSDPSGIDVVRALLSAFEGTGVGRATAFLDGESRLHVSGSSGLAGEYEGRDAILGLAGQVATVTRGTMRFRDVRALGGSPGESAFRMRATASRGARRLDTDVDLMISFARGRIAEIWLRHADQTQVDEFWS